MTRRIFKITVTDKQIISIDRNLYARLHELDRIKPEGSIRWMSEDHKCIRWVEGNFDMKDPIGAEIENLLMKVALS